MSMRAIARTAGAIAAGLLISGGSGASGAAGLCDCCGNDLNASCARVCADRPKAPGQCTATVDYKGKGASKVDHNPLTGISLKEISIGDPTPPQLESFRRFLESNRRLAIRQYNRAAWRLQHGRITEENFAAAKALYREAMVNYYHGMRAYLNKLGVKSD